MPTEAALSVPRSPYVTSVDDYKTELTVGLTEAWKQARLNIKKAQKRQKLHYDKQAKIIDFQPGGRVMVYMPHEHQGKNRKLALPYHGPFRILEVQPNCVVVRPVDEPDDQPIRVSMDRVTVCPDELPDVSWLGPKAK